ncbi:MAG: hypothetical protein LBI80_01540 [Endomicrobium sp.]|jgi:hypothetical protein|nr:hypothetical protein [Endomicrobium sp.]
MKNIFKVTIANSTTFTILMVISLLSNTFFASFPTNVNIHLLQKEKEIFQLRSHLCRIYGTVNIPIKLASKILRCDVNRESNLKTLVHNIDNVHCIIKKDKTNNSNQKNIFLGVFLNSFTGVKFKSKIFKTYINWKHNYNIIELFNIFKMSSIFKFILIFLIIMLSLPRGNPIFIKIINKNISRSQLYFNEAGFIFCHHLDFLYLNINNTGGCHALFC